MRHLSVFSMLSLFSSGLTSSRRCFGIRYGFTGEFGIDATDTGLGIGQIQWDISPSREHRFIFDAECFGHDNTRLEIMAFQWEFPLFANYSCVREQESGSVVVGRRDIGRTPGLAYCDSRPEFFLIPDCVFVPSKGYSAARSFFADNRVAWQDRRSTAFWRGATTGMPSRHGDWASLPRIKLCEISRQHENTGLLDAGISAIVQFTSQSVAEEITKSGLMRGFVPWQKWNHQDLIDIDGNSSPWSNLFQRLLTASTVLKVESISGYRQWYYDKLMPWRNYVPVAPDMWDLIDKIKWLRLHDSAARMIGQRGFELAEELSYERELSRSVPVVSSAFRYFSGRYDNPSPCGTAGGAFQLAHLSRLEPLHWVWRVDWRDAGFGGSRELGYDLNRYASDGVDAHGPPPILAWNPCVRRIANYRQSAATRFGASWLRDTR